jgi:transcriptional regulator with XRE-family HTH domain
MTSLTDKKFLRDLGDRVRQKRLERGWTQDQLGEKCSLHRTFIGSVERGERNVSILNLKLISGVLRVRLSELVDQL